MKVQLRPGDRRLYRSTSHHQDFLNCIRTRRDPICPVETGHRVATICILSDIAIRLGRKLRWDPEKECFPGDDQANRMLSTPQRHPYHL